MCQAKNKKKWKSFENIIPVSVSTTVTVTTTSLYVCFSMLSVSRYMSGGIFALFVVVSTIFCGRITLIINDDKHINTGKQQTLRKP